MKVEPEVDRPYAPPSSGTGVARRDRDLPKKTPVVLMILLTLVTLGLYFPYWFLSRRSAFNRLTYDEDNVNLPTFALACLYLLAFGGGVVEGAAPGALGSLSRAVPLVDLAARILTIVLAFRIKSILEGNHPEPLSAVGTFFLSIFYLQYKINRMEKTDPVSVQFSLR